MEHQGMIYQASAYAALFLVRWLPKAQTYEKPSLVTFLARLARGNSYKRQHLNLTDEHRQRDRGRIAREMAEEIKWVDLTHQAVRAGRDLSLPLIDDQDPQLRMATTYLLASFRED